MIISKTLDLNAKQKASILTLWNSEFPINIAYESVLDFERYFIPLINPIHYLLFEKEDEILGWASSFGRDGERWFSIIVSSKLKGLGYGTALMNKLKENENSLVGWVTDHERYIKSNGEKYLPPLNFYLKNAFVVCPGIRYESEKLSALKIKWQR